MEEGKVGADFPLKERQQEVKKKVAVTVVIALFALVAIVVGFNMRKKGTDTAAGIQKLEAMENMDVKAVEEKILAREEAELKATEEWQNRTNNEKFARAKVIGDSNTQGMTNYEVLSPEIATGTRGTAMCRPDVSGLDDMIANALASQPEQLFMSFGQNDAESARSVEDFIADYKAALDKVKAASPNTKIYVNSVFPVQSWLITEKGIEGYSLIPAYNEALVQLCEAEGAFFIDNSSLIVDEEYEPDGIHMIMDFYGKWANHMAEVAEL